MIQPQAQQSSGRKPMEIVRRFEHAAMGCTFEIYIVAQEARYARQAAQAAFDELNRLEESLSRFLPHSDIARLNALPPGQFLPLGADTIECLQLAAWLYEQTDGAFDIAYRSAQRRRNAGQLQPPLIFDPARHAVALTTDGVDLDLGGLGKGYAIDRMVAVLREWGIQAALVHGGQSTTYALGTGPDGADWRLGLRRPGSRGASVGWLPLRDSALSGSGRNLHGSHVIDPRTGQPACAALGAWVMAPTAAVADGLSTACLVLSAAEVERLCRRRGEISAMLLPAACVGTKAVCFGPHRHAVNWETGRPGRGQPILDPSRE